MMAARFPVAATCAVLLFAAAPAARAQLGSIKGTVKLDGPPPAAKKVAVTKDQETCGKEKTSGFLVVAKDGALKNAVVSLEGVTGASKPAAVTATLDQKTCEYAPHVQAVPVGSTLEIRNSDPVLHNVHSYKQGGATAFNLAMPMKDQKLKKPLGGPGLQSFRCDAGHTWMSAFIWTFDHPWYAVTDEGGRFEIKDVPPGRYKLKVWHEGWRPRSGGSPAETEPVTVEQPVLVEAGKTVPAAVVLKP